MHCDVDDDSINHFKIFNKQFENMLCKHKFNNT